LDAGRFFLRIEFDRPDQTLLQFLKAGTLSVSLARQGRDPIAPALLEGAN
jgi:hypothetical protein